MTERFYLYIYVFSLLAIGAATIITGNTYGEAGEIRLGAFPIALLLLVYLFAFAAAYYYYKRTWKRMPCFRGFPKLDIDRKRIHWFYLICLVISLLGLVLFDNGRVMGTSSTRFSFLFNLIKYSEFFPIYYVAARDTKKKLYWVNILLYCLVRTLCGWTSWILTVGMLEVFFRVKDRGWLRRTFRAMKSGMIAVAGIACGSLAYFFLFPLKNAVRYTTHIKYFRLTVWESLVALVERFCNFATCLSAWQDRQAIADLYQKQGIFLSEFKTIFSPLVPSFIMRNKDIRGMGNIVLWAVYPNMGNGSGTGYGFLMYWYTLFRCSIADFIACAAIAVVSFLLICTLLKAFDNEAHDMRILYFILLIDLARGSPVSQWIGYGYIASLYLIVFMIFLGVIKMKVKRG